MKFKSSRAHFANGLTQVLSIVGHKSTMPILSNVLIEAADGFVTFSTTNLDVGVRCKISAEVARAGAVTLPVRRLSSIVRELPGADVEFDSSRAARVKISSGCSVFNVMGIDKDEFPPLPTVAKSKTFQLSQDDLAELLKSVAFAQSSDETRYILNAVYFKVAPNNVTVVATDGRRLATNSKSVVVENSAHGSFLLPAKTVGEVLRLLGMGVNVSVHFDDRKASFVFDTEKDNSGLKEGVYLYSKVVEGTYPNYSQVIPQHHDNVILERELLLDAVRRGSLVTSEKSNSVALKISENQLEITARGPDVGESQETIAINYSGPGVDLAFNPSFLIEALSAIPHDNVKFEFSNSVSPGVIKTNGSFVCVIMPVRLN